MNYKLLAFLFLFLSPSILQAKCPTDEEMNQVKFVNEFARDILTQANIDIRRISAIEFVDNIWLDGNSQDKKCKTSSIVRAKIAISLHDSNKAVDHCLAFSRLTFYLPEVPANMRIQSKVDPLEDQACLVSK